MLGDTSLYGKQSQLGKIKILFMPVMALSVFAKGFKYLLSLNAITIFFLFWRISDIIKGIIPSLAL